MGHRFDLGFVPRATIVRPPNQHGRMIFLCCRAKGDCRVALVSFSFLFFPFFVFLGFRCLVSFVMNVVCFVFDSLLR